MPTFRVNKTKNYTVMSNHHFKERTMSLKAKGLLSMMLSLPEDWDYSIGGLVALCKENETAVKTALDELKKFGYLSVTKLYPNQTDSGRYEYIYNIYEEPQNQQVEKQPLENLPLEIQGVENQHVENIGLYKGTDKSNTNKSSTKDKIDYESIVAYYNEKCVKKGMAGIQKLTDKRKSLIRSAIKLWGLEKVYEAMDRASESLFLCGKSKKYTFKAGFDFVFNSEKMTRILEGYYDNNIQTTTAYDMDNNMMRDWDEGFN